MTVINYNTGINMIEIFRFTFKQKDLRLARRFSNNNLVLETFLNGRFRSCDQSQTHT